jgi:hypothetical protein
MRKILFLLFTLSALSLQGFSQPLSPAAKISLLVCAPGDEIESGFGHAAIRINDPLTTKDIVFHYGAFSYEAPHFIWRFAKGETDYEIAIQRMDSFKQQYSYYKQSVIEYVLDFSPKEKQFLYDILEENYKPGNRVYRYNHFLDNCATRIRDQIEKTVGGRIKYNTSGDEQLTFRNLIDRYVDGNTWIGLGIKLALGNPTDRITTFSEKMFLPDYLGNDMSKAIVTRDGHQSPLISGSSMIIEAPLPDRSFSFTSPAVVLIFFFLLTLILTIWEIRKDKRFIWLDVSVFAAFGIAALILYFTTFISIMTWTKWNFNLIWAWPTHLFIAVFWLFPSMRAKLKWYMQLTSVVLILFLLSMFFLPQTFHWLVVPICLMLLLRTGTFKNIGSQSHISTIL